jgi:hypothetical protein
MRPKTANLYFQSRLALGLALIIKPSTCPVSRHHQLLRVFLTVPETLPSRGPISGLCFGRVHSASSQVTARPIPIPSLSATGGTGAHGERAQNLERRPFARACRPSGTKLAHTPRLLETRWKGKLENDAFAPVPDLRYRSMLRLNATIRVYCGSCLNR